MDGDKFSEIVSKTLLNVVNCINLNLLEQTRVGVFYGVNSELISVKKSIVECFPCDDSSVEHIFYRQEGDQHGSVVNVFN